MKSAENLLAFIKNDYNHPFDFLKISDDYKSIISFDGKEKIIYNDSGKICKEDLLREIFVNVFLKNEINYYISERVGDDNSRCDLFSKLHETSPHKNSIIEFKHLFSNSNEKNIRQEIDSAFSQVQNKYIDENKKTDTYVSIVLMDVEKIIKNTINLEKFYTSEKNTQQEALKLFKELGICIITKQYVAEFRNYDTKQIWFHIPKHCIITIDRDDKDEFGPLMQKYALVKDVIYFPTSSSENGIKNVRDVKDPKTSSSKKRLIIKIFETIIKAYKNKNPKLLSTYGKEKDFVFSKNEIIIEKITESDKFIFNLSLMNGAIVDGQNSIDCFKIILNYLKNYANEHSNESRPNYYSTLDKKLKENNIMNERDRRSLMEFLEKMKININIKGAENNEETKEIAINKNNTIAVSKNELDISEFFQEISVIGKTLLNENILLGYPQRQYLGISSNTKKDYIVEYDDLAKFSAFYRDLKKSQNFDFCSFFNYKDILSKSNPTKNIVALFTEHIEKIVDEETDDYKEIQKEIEMKNHDIRMNEKFIKKLESEENPSYDLIEEYEEEIENAKEEIKKLEEEMGSRKNYLYKIKDADILINTSNAIIDIRKIIKKIFTDIDKEKLKKMIIKNQKTLLCYSYIILLHKTNYDLKNATKEMINDIVQKVIEWPDKLQERNIKMTDFSRNIKKGRDIENNKKILQELFE